MDFGYLGSMSSGIFELDGFEGFCNACGDSGHGAPTFRTLSPEPHSPAAETCNPDASSSQALNRIPAS